MWGHGRPRPHWGGSQDGPYLSVKALRPLPRRWAVEPAPSSLTSATPLTPPETRCRAAPGHPPGFRDLRQCRSTTSREVLLRAPGGRSKRGESRPPGPRMQGAGEATQFTVASCRPAPSRSHNRTARRTAGGTRSCRLSVVSASPRLFGPFDAAARGSRRFARRHTALDDAGITAAGADAALVHEAFLSRTGSPRGRPFVPSDPNSDAAERASRAQLDLTPVPRFRRDAARGSEFGRAQTKTTAARAGSRKRPIAAPAPHPPKALPER